MVCATYIPFRISITNNNENKTSITFSYISLFLAIITIIILSTVSVLTSYNLTKTKTDTNISYGDTYKIKYTCLKSTKCFIKANYEYDPCRKYNINGNITLLRDESIDIEFCSSPIDLDGHQLIIHQLSYYRAVEKNAILSTVSYKDKIINIPAFELFKTKPLFFGKTIINNDVTKEYEELINFRFGNEMLDSIETCIAVDPTDPYDKSCFSIILKMESLITTIETKFLYTTIDMLSKVLSYFVIIPITETFVILIKKRFLLSNERMIKDKNIELSSIDIK